MSIPAESFEPKAGHVSRLPLWLVIARAEIGVAEIEGSEHNERVLEYHRATSLGASDDETPWCSSFVNWAMAKAGNPGTRSAAAQSWLNWGSKLNDPCVGAIVVLRRGREAWMGHVGIITDWTPGKIKVLGGNQGGRVCEMWFDRDDVLGYRWPKELHTSKTMIATAAIATAQTAHSAVQTVLPSGSGHGVPTNTTPAPPINVPVLPAPQAPIVDDGFLSQLQTLLPSTSGALRAALVTVVFAGLLVIVYERYLKNKNGNIG